MKMHLSPYLWALTLLLLSATAIQAQNVVGVVNDENGIPMPGVTVRIEGTTQGDATDLDGKYEIKNAPVGEQVLIFSFIGYTEGKQTINVAPSGTLTVNRDMSVDSETLEEFVVVGYGVQRKREVTGSIEKVTTKQITDIPTPSFEAGLQGKAAGVQVTQGSGLAGSASVVRVRGIASISAAGDPLYVVDGIPITQDYFLNGDRGAMNNNPLATINPNDIESVEILKDAAATGIYGSRGANGVILITTKKGTTGGWAYNVDTRHGVSVATRLPDMLNNQEWLQLYQEAHENDGGVGLAPLPNGITWDQARNTNTDWIDETTGVGFKQAYNFSSQYADDKFNFFGSLGYDANGTYLVGNSYERTSLRANAGYKINDQLELTATTSASRGVNNRVAAAWNGGLGAAMSSALPIYPIFFQDTVFSDGRVVNLPGDYWDDGPNPVRDRELRDWRTTEWRSINSLTLQYRPTNKLFVKVYGGYDYMDLKDDTFQPVEYIQGNRIQREDNPSENYALAERRPTWTNNWNTNATVTYFHDIDEKTDLTYMLGLEYQSSVTRSKNRLWRQDSLLTVPAHEDSDLYATLNRDDENSPAGAYNSDGNGVVQDYNFISAFGRVNYARENKYYAQATFRTDGSSRFGENNRFGFFPSASVGWVLSEENFLKASESVSFLKVRAGWGITGNASIPNYQQYGTYEIRQNGYNNQDFRFLATAPNPDLQWETSSVFDLGIEFGLWQDRLTGTLSLYNKTTNDVLLNVNPPPSTGLPSLWDNAGQIVNRGIELELSTFTMDRENFTWRTDFNVAYNYNEITDAGGYSNDALGGGFNDTRVAVGEPVGANFLNVYSRVDPETGRPLYIDADGNETFILDLNDRRTVGRVLPFAVGGITNTFTMGRWEVGLVMVYSVGSDIYDGSAKYQYHPAGQGTPWNSPTDAFDRWRQPGDQTYLPIRSELVETYGLPSVDNWNTTQWLDDGDYLRLRRLSVAYSIPGFNLGTAAFRGATFTLSAVNFLTITNFDGLDPEIARDFQNAQDRNLSPNVNYLTPPQEMSFNFAVNLRF